MYKLSVKQMNHFDELKLEQFSAEETLKVAIQYCENRMSAIAKERDSLWNEIAEIHSIDLNEKQYTYNKKDGVVSVIEKED